MKVFLFNGIGVSSCLFLGRLLGFLRDTAIINFYGQTYDADLMVFIMIFQDIIMNFFMGNAFSVAIMTDFLNKKFNFFETLKKFRVLSIKISVFILVFVLLFLSNLLDFMIPALPAQYKTNSITYLYVSLVSIPFTFLSCVDSNGLNSKEIFIYPAFSNLVYNIIICFFIILSYVFFTHRFIFIAVGVLFASLFRWFFLTIRFSNTDNSCNETNSASIPEFIKRYFFSFFSGLIVLAISILARSFVTKIGEGQYANFNYVMKIMDLPQGLIMGPFLTILIPRIFKDKEKFFSQRQIITLTVAGLIFSISCIIYVLSDWIVFISFVLGKASKIAESTIASQIRMSAMILPFYVLATFLSTILSSTKNAKFNALLNITVVMLFYVVGKHHVTIISDLYLLMGLSYAIYCSIGFVLLRLSRE